MAPQETAASTQEGRVHRSTSGQNRRGARIAGLLEVLFEDPSFYHLVIDRIIHGKSLQVRNMRNDLVHGTVEALKTAINEGVASGEFRRFDPRHLFLAMIGACGYPMAERAVFAELVGREPTRTDLDAYIKSIVELFLHGLEGNAIRRRPTTTALVTNSS